MVDIFNKLWESRDNFVHSAYLYVLVLQVHNLLLLPVFAVLVDICDVIREKGPLHAISDCY